MDDQKPAPAVVASLPLKNAEELLKRVVMTWDCDESMDFMAAIRESRQFLGLKLADEAEDRNEFAVLKANGYEVQP